jgi:hypothetical protein
MLEFNGKPSSVTMFSIDFSLPKLGFFGVFISILCGKNHLKFNYLPHFESKSYQINSIKLHSSRSFQ